MKYAQTQPKALTSGECLRVRKRTQLAQRPFAKLVGIGIASVLKYETDKATPEKTPQLLYKMLQEDPHLIKMMLKLNGHKLTPNEYKRARELCDTVWVVFKPLNDATQAYDKGFYQEYRAKQARIRERMRSLGETPPKEQVVDYYR